MGSGSERRSCEVNIAPKGTKLMISPLMIRTGTATFGTCVKAEGNRSPGVKHDTAGAGVMYSITGIGAALAAAGVAYSITRAAFSLTVAGVA